MNGDPVRGLKADLVFQRDFVASRAPIYARVLDLLIGLIGETLLEQIRRAWRERSFGARYERPC